MASVVLILFSGGDLGFEIISPHVTSMVKRALIDSSENPVPSAQFDAIVSYNSSGSVTIGSHMRMAYQTPQILL